MNLKKRLLAMAASIAIVIGLLPMTTLAADTERSGSGTEEDPYVYKVWNASNLSEAVAAINADSGDSTYYTISLQDDIECNGLSFSKAIPHKC